MMTTRIFPIGLALIGLACLTGCPPTTTPTTSASPAAPTVRVTGVVYGPASQVAIINSGAFNYKTLARSDEKAAANAKVVFLRGGVPVVSAVADGSGTFGVDIAAGNFFVTTTLKLKSGDATHTGIAIVGSSGGKATLDAANACVGAKLQALGVKARSMDPAKLQTALDQMGSALSGLSSVPDTTTDGAAIAAFDANAGADCKASVQALLAANPTPAPSPTP